MMVKIIEIARELNIGLNRAVDYLMTKGIEIERIPYARIDDEAVILSLRQFLRK